MTIATDVLELHFATFVANHERWKSMIAEDLLWELPFGPTLGHPARLSGREQVLSHAEWFVGAVENFRFFDLKIHPGANPDEASAEVKADGLIKSTGRIYEQDYVVFIKVANGKLAFIREYFDPVRAAIALEAPIPALAG
jgi:ketosteroid isomerase-like protein